MFKLICIFSGGSGRISLALTNHYDDLTATVFDLPPVVQLAKKLMPANEDIQFVAGKLSPFYSFRLVRVWVYSGTNGFSYVRK